MDLNLKPGICSNGNGDNISPITSTSTVYRNNKKLDDILADKASIEPLNEEGIIISVENESIEEVLNSIHDNTANIKTSLGSTTDVGGTNNSGTINGKLNKIIANTENINFDDIVTKIGNTEDSNGTSSTGGIFAKINKLLTDWTTARANKIDSIYTNTEPSTSSSSTGTLSQKLNYIKSLIGTSSDNGTTTIFGLLKKTSSKGIVKSIQRGVTTSTSITISTVVPDKCLVLLNNSRLGEAGRTGHVSGSILSSITETELTITNNESFGSIDGITRKVSWQVIEFY